MGAIDIQEQPLTEENASPTGGQIFNNVKRLKAGDGSWRFENGALIISDETGTDRVHIGYLKDKF